MATKPFDRMILNLAERPVSVDINQLQSNRQRAEMLVLDALTRGQTTIFVPTIGTVPLAAGTPLGAFFADGFFVAAGGGMNLSITRGLGLIYNASDLPATIGGLSGVDDLSPMKPLPLDATQTLTVPAGDPVNPRIDIIEVTYQRRLEQPASRDILNVSNGLILPTSVNKVLGAYLDGQVGNFTTANSTTGIGYKLGTPAGSPVAPATTSGYVKVAEVLVDAVASSVPQTKIRDTRIFALTGRPVGWSARITITHNGTTVTSLSANFFSPVGVRGCVTVPQSLIANSVWVILLVGTNGGAGNIADVSLGVSPSSGFSGPSTVFAPSGGIAGTLDASGPTFPSSADLQAGGTAAQPTIQAATGQPYVGEQFNVNPTPGTYRYIIHGFFR